MPTLLDDVSRRISSLRDRLPDAQCIEDLRYRIDDVADILVDIIDLIRERDGPTLP